MKCWGEKERVQILFMCLQKFVVLVECLIINIIVVFYASCGEELAWRRKKLSGSNHHDGSARHGWKKRRRSWMKSIWHGSSWMKFIWNGSSLMKSRRKFIMWRRHGGVSGEQCREKRVWHSRKDGREKEAETEWNEEKKNGRVFIGVFSQLWCVIFNFDCEWWEWKMYLSYLISLGYLR